MKAKMFPAILSSVSLLSSCMPQLYHPSTINAPLFSKKGEVNISAVMSSAGTDVQAAYSNSEHTGFIFNWSGGNKMRTDYLSGSTFEYDIVTGNYVNTPYNYQYHSGYRFNYAEGGYGFYLKPESGSKLRAEIFGLIGAGDAESGAYGFNGEAKASYLRYTLQGDIGYAGNITEGALSVRFGYLDFSGLQTSPNNISPNYGSWMYNSYDSYPGSDKTSFFIDPALTFRIGYKGVKMITQFGISIPSSNHVSFGWTQSWASIGMHFRINTSK